MGISAKINKTKRTFWDFLYPPRLGEKLAKIDAELDMAERKRFFNEIKEEQKIQHTKVCPNCGYRFASSKKTT